MVWLNKHRTLIREIAVCVQCEELNGEFFKLTIIVGTYVASPKQIV